jgi:hypothetical protein
MRNYRATLSAMELGLATFADLSAGVSPAQRMRDLMLSSDDPVRVFQDFSPSCAPARSACR